MGITFTFWKIWFFILLNYDHTTAETLIICQSSDIYADSDARHIARIETSDGTTAFYELYDNGGFDTDGGCTAFDVFDDTTGSFMSIDIHQCEPNAGAGLDIRNIIYGSVIINSFSGDHCINVDDDNSLAIDQFNGGRTPNNLCESVNVDSNGNVASNVNVGGTFDDAIFNTACENAILSRAPTMQTSAPEQPLTVYTKPNTLANNDKQINKNKIILSNKGELGDDDDDISSEPSSAELFNAKAQVENELNQNENNTQDVTIQFDKSVIYIMVGLCICLVMNGILCVFCKRKNQNVVFKDAMPSNV